MQWWPERDEYFDLQLVKKAEMIKLKKQDMLSQSQLL